MRTAAAGLTCFLMCVGVLLTKISIEKRNLLATRHAPPITLESAYFETDSLRRFSLGFDNILADLIWIRLLQEATVTPVHENEVSWEFTQLDALTSLDSNFEHAYPFGAAFLSIFRRDKEGAKRILAKWIQHNPISWRSHYLLGYHLYSEMLDYKDASAEMLKAAQLSGAPPWLTALGVRLVSEQGQYLPALQIALELYPSIASTDGKQRLIQRIRSLRYQLQKTIWTKALISYREKNKHAPPSIASLHPFRDIPRGVAEIESESMQSTDLSALLSERFQFTYDAQTESIQGKLGPEDKYLESVGIYRRAGERAK